MDFGQRFVGKGKKLREKQASHSVYQFWINTGILWLFSFLFWFFKLQNDSCISFSRWLLFLHLFCDISFLVVRCKCEIFIAEAFSHQWLYSTALVLFPGKQDRSSLFFHRYLCSVRLTLYGASIFIVSHVIPLLFLIIPIPLCNLNSASISGHGAGMDYGSFFYLPSFLFCFILCWHYHFVLVLIFYLDKMGKYGQSVHLRCSGSGKFQQHH